MVNKGEDVTSRFNPTGVVNLDIGEWDWVIVQVVGPTGTITFNASCDGGAIHGETTGNATSAINFTAVQATNLATGAATTTSAASGLFKFSVVGKYLQSSSPGQTATKIIVYTAKIQ